MRRILLLVTLTAFILTSVLAVCPTSAHSELIQKRDTSADTVSLSVDTNNELEVMKGKGNGDEFTVVMVVAGILGIAVLLAGGPILGG